MLWMSALDVQYYLKKYIHGKPRLRVSVNVFGAIPLAMITMRKSTADQYHVTISRAQVYNSSRSPLLFKLTTDQVLVFVLDRGLMSG